MEESLNPEEVRKNYLNNIHLAAFDNYLNAVYPNGHEGVPETEIDMQFKAFVCGFNSGIYQSAGEILTIVGVNLNNLQSAQETKE